MFIRRPACRERARSTPPPRTDGVYPCRAAPSRGRSDLFLLPTAGGNAALNGISDPLKVVGGSEGRLQLCHGRVSVCVCVCVCVGVIVNHS